MLSSHFPIPPRIPPPPRRVVPPQQQQQHEEGEQTESTTTTNQSNSSDENPHQQSPSPQAATSEQEQQQQEHHDDTDSVVDGQPVSLADALYNVDENPRYQETYYEAVGDRISLIGWGCLFLFFVLYWTQSRVKDIRDNHEEADRRAQAYNAASASSSSFNRSSSSSSDFDLSAPPTAKYNKNFATYTPVPHADIDPSVALFWFMVPLGLLQYLIKTRGVDFVPVVLMLRRFFATFLAAFWVVLPISSVMAAFFIGLFSALFWVKHEDSDGHTVSDHSASDLFNLAAQAIAFVIVSEMGKFHCFETRDSRARCRRPAEYVYLGLSYAVGFSALEAFFAAGMNDVTGTFLELAKSPTKRTICLYLWWLFFSVMQTAAHCLSSYMLSMAVARRDLRLINNLESQLAGTRRGETRDTLPVLEDEQKPLRRPFGLCVAFRSIIFMASALPMVEFTLATRNWRLQGWSAVLCCAGVALGTLFLFFVYVVAYQSKMMPATYLKVTGYLSLGGLIPLPSDNGVHEQQPEAEEEDAEGDADDERQQQAGDAEMAPAPSAIVATAESDDAAAAADASAADERQPLRGAAAAAEDGANQQQHPQQNRPRRQHHHRRAALGNVIGWVELEAQRRNANNNDAASSSSSSSSDSDAGTQAGTGDAETSSTAAAAAREQRRLERRERRRAERAEEERRRQRANFAANVFVVAERPRGYDSPAVVTVANEVEVKEKENKQNGNNDDDDE